jgi:hypothetical protein
MEGKSDRGHFVARALAVAVVVLCIPVLLVACEAAAPQAEVEGSAVEQTPVSEPEIPTGQEPSGTEDDASSRDDDVPRGQGPRQGFGMPGESSLTAVAADELGMTEEELTGELENGKSITDLANERGVDPQIIADALVAQLAEDLAQSVADGNMTQEQADQMMQRMEERGLDSFFGPPAGFGPPEGFEPPEDFEPRKGRSKGQSE